MIRIDQLKCGVMGLTCRDVVLFRGKKGNEILKLISFCCLVSIESGKLL